jgi:flagellar assembly protein FliH
MVVEYFKPPAFGDEVVGDTSQATKVVPENLDDQANSNDPLSTQAVKYDFDSLEEAQVIKDKIDHSAFDSTKFNKVGTLLTNVEEYSKKIREDVEKYERQIRDDIDLMKSEVELELAQALIEKKDAEEKAAQIIKETNESRDRIIEEGRKEGFDAGIQDGQKQFQEQNEENTRNILNILKELETLRMDTLHGQEEQIVKLSLLIAKKIVHQQLTIDKKIVVEMVKSTISQFDGMGDIRISVNPVEYEFIASYQSEINDFVSDVQAVKIRKDQQIEAGVAKIETDFSAVDLDFCKQFDEIDNQLSQCVEDRRQVFKVRSKQ